MSGLRILRLVLKYPTPVLPEIAGLREPGENSSSFRCALVGFSARMRDISSGSAVAETSYRAAIAIAQQQSAKFWELRVAMSLSRLWRVQDKRVQARDLLAPVYGWFIEGFGTGHPWLR